MRFSLKYFTLYGVKIKYIINTGFINKILEIKKYFVIISIKEERL